MLSSGLLHWLTSDQGVMALLAQNWLLGIMLIALVVFLETGLVVLPFLPGDSLLFATGAFLGIAGISPIIPLLIIIAASILGDNVNYTIGGSRIGRFLIDKNWIKPHHMEKTRAFYDKYGAMTIIMGRFVPVVRTVAPFVAGLSGMCRRRFTLFNILGGSLWSSSLILSGVWLCHFEWVKSHISLLSLAIVIISVLPVVLHVIPQLRKQEQA